MHIKLNQAEEFWNQRYNTQEFIFGKEPNHYLKQKTELYLINKSKILCVADGEGRNSVWLAKQGHDVEAFDVSSIAIEKAKQLSSQHQVHVQYIHADCDTFDWKTEEYDAIAVIFIQFAEPELRKRLFQNIYRSLKLGGLLILQGYTPKQLDYKTGGPSDLSLLYTEELMRELLNEMEILEMQSYEQELQEGSRHSGMSALIGLVAKKH